MVPGASNPFASPGRGDETPSGESDDREPELLAVERLNPVLQESANWPHGQLRSLTVERIGLDFGLSGRSHLVTVMTESGEIAHLAAKIETAESIARAVAFRRQNERAFSDFIPASYGAVLDDGSADGVILLEYVHPAEQADVLIGTTEMRALDLMRTMGRLHGHTWRDAGQDEDLQFQWAAEAWKQSRWMDRLVRAHERYPEVISESHVDRLTGFPSEVAAAILNLRLGRTAGSITIPTSTMCCGGPAVRHCCSTGRER